MNATLSPVPARLERELAAIRLVVCEHHGIPRSEMTSRARTEPLATIRQTAMFLGRELTAAPLQTIARSFARDDHQTVRHACAVLPDKMQTNPRLKATVDVLRERAKAAIAKLK